jgi:rare lipoprotein A
MNTLTGARAKCVRFGGRLAAGLAVLGAFGLFSGCAGTGSKHASPGGTAEIADAVPKVEPKSKYGNPKSYVVFGKRYYTKASADGHVERGLASWYGKKFHGRRTSSGERYNMHAMTAAHKSLPLPTYVKVTNLKNGRSAVVKVNDRGPFHDKRVIDLSYAAAKKLGVVRHGTAMVEVRAIDPRNPGSGGFSNSLLADAGSAAKSTTKPKSARKPAPVLAGEADPKRSGPSATEIASTSLEPKPAAKPQSKKKLEPAVAAANATSRSSDATDVYLQVGAFGSRSNAEQLRRQLLDQLEEKVLVRTADGSKAQLYKVHVGPLDSRGEADVISEKLASLGLTKALVVEE